MDIKIIVITVLTVSLIAAAGWIVVLQQDKTKDQYQIKNLVTQNSKLIDERNTAKRELSDAQEKISKGIAYAKAMDTILEPGRQQAGIAADPQFSEINWMLEFKIVTEATNDEKLQAYFDEIASGGDSGAVASVKYMSHTASAILEALK